MVLEDDKLKMYANVVASEKAFGYASWSGLYLIHCILESTTVKQRLAFQAEYNIDCNKFDKVTESVLQSSIAARTVQLERLCRKYQT